MSEDRGIPVDDHHVGEKKFFFGTNMYRPTMAQKVNRRSSLKETERTPTPRGFTVKPGKKKRGKVYMYGEFLPTCNSDDALSLGRVVLVNCPVSEVYE